jgi:broad specificity phosphatase PhoE
MSTRLFLVRHGESVWNAEGRAQGQADPPLSARGIGQAYALAGALGARSIDAVYCSPLARATATASTIAAPHDLVPCVAAGLREVHLGSWQGRALADLDAAGDGCTVIAAPDGETLAAARDRVAPVINAILTARAGHTIVVVTHSIIGRVILCHLLRASLDLVPRLKLKQASLSMLRLDGDGAVLERLGDTHHLDAPSVDHTRAGIVEGARS